jgi:hypothetical protein
MYVGYGGFVSGRSVRPVSGRFVSPDAPTTRAIGTTLVDRAQASGPGYLSESARRQVQSARRRTWATSARRWVQERPQRVLSPEERQLARERLYVVPNYAGQASST